MRIRAESEKVSPTAYATGYFWYRHGLSHEGLTVPEGKRLDRRFRLLIRTVKLVSGMSIEALMLARHKGIDALLTKHIESGRVTQVIELAAGLSARGWRFSQRYPDKLTYVETDLPHMAARKRDMLEAAKLGSPRHRVETVNVLMNRGPGSMHELAQSLDRTAGLAIITEGLLSYLPREAVDGIWRRFARAAGRFQNGTYISDIQLEMGMTPEARAFRVLLAAFVRGPVNIHFERPEDVEAALRKAGFSSATARPAVEVLGRKRGRPSRTHILEASTK